MPPSRRVIVPLATYYDESPTAAKYEICIDEVARGPLFGPVYVTAVVLQRPVTYDVTGIKDSKKFSNRKKRDEMAEYIRDKVLYWHIEHLSNVEIDNMNILRATFLGMHRCVNAIMEKIRIDDPEVDMLRDILVCIDGDKFDEMMVINNAGEIGVLPYVTIEQGDAKYVGIAAASILAKSAHDKYIGELCDQYPDLNERYAIGKNMGYGTAEHIAGIERWGVTQWHRTTFARCRDVRCNCLFPNETSDTVDITDAMLRTSLETEL